MRLNKKKVSFLISGKGSNLYKILVNNLKNEKFFIVSIIDLIEIMTHPLLSHTETNR